MKTAFLVGDTAVATKTIRRRDGRSVIRVGERVKITHVYEGEEYQIVSIEPFSGKLPMKDVCCDIGGPLKKERK